VTLFVILELKKGEEACSAVSSKKNFPASRISLKPLPQITASSYRPFLVAGKLAP
jgi:hypothetical protein